MKRLLLISLLCTPIATWAFFKPVRVAAPELTGLSCFDDTVCTDNVSRHQEAAQLYEEARHFVDSSVGTIEKKPRVIFCSSDACSQFFGMGKRAGINVGTLGIVISPRAWKSHYVRHEIIHHLQYEKLGIFAAWCEPQWFMEGMAYALSEDPRPKLSEPFEQYRSQFIDWYVGVSKDRLWTEARKL